MVFVLILVFVLVIVIVFSGKPLFTQCIAMADAKHCDGRCKALQERMQSFAWVVAKLCVLIGNNWHRYGLSYSGLEKREESSPYGAL